MGGKAWRGMKDISLDCYICIVRDGRGRFGG
jgi:hypothetical protein